LDVLNSLSEAKIPREKSNNFAWSITLTGSPEDITKPFAKLTHPKVLRGIVVSCKTDKTVIVRVERKVMHPKYQKYIKKSTRIMAHDELNACTLGDTISIRQCRPMSKLKHFEVILRNNPSID
jgi:small subunit ribosomal protein S17